MLGRSDGTPGQSYALLNPPILPRRLDAESPEQVEVVGADGTFEPWVEVETFAQSRPTDPHYTIDNLTGEVRFGPRIVAPSGEEQQYGRVPPKGQLIRFSRYRSGGGSIGNVGQSTLVVPKSASDLPYVKWVANLRPAIGGRDRETLEAFRLRGPQLVRTREVAVTRSDFEHHALEASPRIGRVRCVAPRAQSTSPGTSSNGSAPGHVRLLLVPAVSTVDRPLNPEELEVPHEVSRSVYAYLRERCPLTTELVVAQPGYRWISVRARLVIRPRPGLDDVAQERRRTAIVDGAVRRLYAFLHPVKGGSDASGWPFGGSLTLGDVYPLLQNDPDVEYVDEVRFRQVTHNPGRTAHCRAGRVAGTTVGNRPGVLVRARDPGRRGRGGSMTMLPCPRPSRHSRRRRWSSTSKPGSTAETLLDIRAPAVDDPSPSGDGRGNNGTGAAFVDLHFSGLNASWYSLSERRLRLEPGETARVLLVVHPPAMEHGAEPGVYDWDLDVVANTGDFTSMRGRVIVTAPGSHLARGERPSHSQLIDFLPRHHQSDEFLARFLLIFQVAFDRIEGSIDNTHFLLDPGLTPPGISHLAGQLAGSRPPQSHRCRESAAAHRTRRRAVPLERHAPRSARRARAAPEHARTDCRKLRWAAAGSGRGDGRQHAPRPGRS